MPNRYCVFSSDGKFVDALKSGISLRDRVGNWEKIKEGDYYWTGSEWKCILREANLTLGVRLSGSDMVFTWSYNNSLITNPKIAIMGSSSAVSQGLPFSQSIEKKIQDYWNANHGGCTTQNFGLSGADSKVFLPISMGGNPANSIDTVIASNPSFILLFAPSNDVIVGNTNQQWLDNLRVVIQKARQSGVPIFLQSPGPRAAYNLTQQTLLRDAAIMQIADPDLQYNMIDVYNSDLWIHDDPSNPAMGNPALIQSDKIHLNGAGTTYMVENRVVPIVERELRPNTAYLSFKIEKSDDEESGWNLYDSIGDQQIISKSYPKDAGFYRVTASLKNGSVLPYSNVIRITNTSPVANAGSDQALAAGTTSIILVGSGSDSDGTIVSYFWEIVSGVGITLLNANTNAVTVKNLSDGNSYILKLTVTDDKGASGNDSVNINVGGVAKKVTRIMLSKTTVSPVPGYINMYGDPYNTTPNIVDPVTGFGLASQGPTFWTNFGSSNAQNGYGATVDDGNGVFRSWAIEVIANYIYEYNTSFNASTPKYQLKIFGLDPAKEYNIYTLPSRSNANGVTGPYSTRYNLLDLIGNEQQEVTIAFQNTHSGCSFVNKKPNANGEMFLAINKGANGQFGYLNAIEIEEII